MPAAYQQLITQPGSGGDLITRLSVENVNGSNYVLKRDWRRVTDAEVRREGHTKFAPDNGVEAALQYLVETDGEINLIHFARKPNGQTAVIVGTATSLYRFFSFEDGGVYTIDVYDAGVYADVAGQWLRIGTNFSPDGNRWEAKDVAGRTVFNNGTDLPVIYDLGWLEVRPIYELRDQGIAFVGTIEEYNGMLVVGDVAEYHENEMFYVMTGRSESSAAQSGYTVTATGNLFLPGDVGKTIVFSANGQYAKILDVPGAGNIATVDTLQTVPLGAFRVATLYGIADDPVRYDRVQYRIIVSDIGDAEDFKGGALTISLASTLSIVGLYQPTFQFQPGDEIVIPGAGPSGAALIAHVLAINGTYDTLTIDTPIITSVTGVFVQKSSRVESVSQGFDLQDDGSAIIRLVELQGRLVVFKDTGIFVGQFTGANPLIQFQKVYSGGNSIGWKWMLAKVDGTTILYAGSNAFYNFDLSSLSPRLNEKLFLCDSLFFEAATDRAMEKRCWATDNQITSEVWFVYPSETEDKGLCYDYVHNTVSTLGAVYTAANMVEKPVGGVQIGQGEDWFIMGTGDGHVFLYGLTNLNTGLWTRDDETYDSIFKSGFIDAGDEFNEKDLRNYVIYFRRFTTPVIVALYGGRNANEPPTLLFSRSIFSPSYKTLIPTYYRKNYYQDQIRVTEQTTNVEVVRKVFEFAGIDSRSAIRNLST